LRVITDLRIYSYLRDSTGFFLAAIALCQLTVPRAIKMAVMADTSREQIFIPFFTTREGGTGIGLSLSKQIMLKLGGDITLGPADSVYTCFSVSLPA